MNSLIKQAKKLNIKKKQNSNSNSNITPVQNVESNFSNIYKSNDYKNLIKILNDVLDKMFMPMFMVDSMKINMTLQHQPFVHLQEYEEDVIESQIEYNNASKFYKKWVRICSEEILKEKIEKNNGHFNSYNELVCFLIASILLSCKTIIGPDHFGTYNVYEFLFTYNNSCNRDKILEFEEDLFRTTNFNSCRETMYEMYEGGGFGIYK